MSQAMSPVFWPKEKISPLELGINRGVNPFLKE